MRVNFSDNRIIIQNPLAIDLGSFEENYQKIEQDINRTSLIEKEAQALVENGFLECCCYAFMESVIRWGKGFRFLDRAKENSPGVVRKAVCEAFKLGEGGKIAEAVERIAELEHVGHSFASKHLRMLMPTKAATLDSRLRDRLGYQATNESYEQFLNDLRVVLSVIKASAIVPREIRDKLRLCDVEMVIYALAEN